ncbi:MAG: hypothetical protein Q9195_002526 [Heterodermia aff. obscurata]
MARLVQRLGDWMRKISPTYPNDHPSQRRDVEQNDTTQVDSSQFNSSTSFRPAPNLHKFQNLIGIQSHQTLIHGRPAPNYGIYKRTVDQEARARYGVRLATYLVNSLFLLQIVVGAVLTALGASGGSSGAVTFFGALNTIVAGILTYLKGQGLPARLEQSLHLLRTLREHIEEREREFTDPQCSLDVDEVVQSIVQMYKEVRQTAEDNAPGNVLAPKGTIEALMKKTDEGNHVPIPGRTSVGVKTFRDEVKDAQAVLTKVAPVVKHGLKDIKTAETKAQHEMESQEEKLHDIIEEVKDEKDDILRAFTAGKRRRDEN